MKVSRRSRRYVIGGVELKDIVAGKVAESRIPPEVVHAFHEQYPNVNESFVAAVHRLSGHPEQLRASLAASRENSLKNST